MQRHQSAESRLTLRTALSRLALIAFGMLSVLGLGGCQVIEGIFKVGAWFGALIVIAVVAVIGGIAVMVMKKR